MRYYTCKDLCETIYRNIYRIPRDIDAVIGIPRSGMLPATIIAEYLHKPLCTVTSFIENGKDVGAGSRRYYIKRTRNGKVLVVDDTVNNGFSIFTALQQIRDRGYSGTVYTCAVFGEGSGTDLVDICMSDIRGGYDYLYEWNIFNHVPEVMAYQVWDMDGCLCVEPPDERNTKAYERYITEAVPMFSPINQIGAICTSRLEKYRLQTETWLKTNNITCGELEMVNLPDYDARSRWNRYAEHKAEFYAARPWAKLFIESSEWQADRIYHIANKPVLSIESNTLRGWQ